MAFTVTVTPDKLSVQDLTECEFETAEQLTAAFTVYEEGDKKGEAFVPAIFSPCPDTCHGAVKGRGLDCGGGSSHRLNANVKAMTMFVLDLDKLSLEQMVTLQTQLQERHIRHWFYCSHGHTPQQPKARIVMPFTEPMPLPSPEFWSQHAWPKLVEWIGPAAIDNDHSCRDACRLYFGPRKPESIDNGHYAYYSDGESIEWRAVVPLTFENPTQAPQAPHQTEEEDPSRPVDLEDLRARLRTVRKEPEKALIKNLLTPAPIVDIEARGRLSRYEAWRTLTAVVALKAHAWESTEAIEGLLRLAHAAEERQQDDPTPWETVQHLLASGRDSAGSWKAKKEQQQRQSINAVMRRLKTYFARPGEAAPVDHVSEELPAGEENEEVPEGEPDDWRAELDMVTRYDKTGARISSEIRPCLDNAVKILANHPNWKGCLRFNRLEVRYELHGSPVNESAEPQIARDADFSRISVWLWDHLRYRIPSLMVREALIVVAGRCAFDPLQDYLNGLKWDKVPRAEGWLMRYMGAVPKDPLEQRYLESAGSKWLISAAARALKPGCKADVAIHFEGEQGTRKSSALAVLGGQWFTDADINFKGDKDSLQLITKRWIVELGELTSFNRSAANEQKAFLAKSSDLFRPPYGTVPEEWPRRCVFAGTTNRDEYLTDDTGNRRHWPVATGKIDLEALRADRDQLWAEAVALYRAGAQWHMSAEDQELANVQTELRMTHTILAEEIQAWFLSKEPAKRPREIKALDVRQALSNQNENDNKIGAALRELKFIRKRVGPVRLWCAPENLLNAPRNGSPRHLQALPTPEKETTS